MRPPIVLPAELGVSLEELFRAVDRGAVPELAPLLDYLAEHDPDVLAAIAEVDRSLIWSALEASPLELLRRCCENARGIQSLAAVLDPRLVSCGKKRGGAGRRAGSEGRLSIWVVRSPVRRAGSARRRASG